jgi:hypothetical protein
VRHRASSCSLDARALPIFEFEPVSLCSSCSCRRTLRSLEPSGQTSAAQVFASSVPDLAPSARNPFLLVRRVVGFRLRFFVVHMTSPQHYRTKPPPSLQAGITELAVAVNMWLGAMATGSPSVAPPRVPRGADILSVGGRCRISPLASTISTPDAAPAPSPVPSPGPLGYCGVILNRFEVRQRWGTVFHATPRSIFESPSMPEDARPGGAFGRKLVASDAELDRVTDAFRKLLIPTWAPTELFSPVGTMGVKEEEVRAVIASALLATFAAPGASAAQAWSGAPYPRPLASVGGFPAIVIEESPRATHQDLQFSVSRGLTVAAPGGGQDASPLKELKRIASMNALESA